MAIRCPCAGASHSDCDLVEEGSHVPQRFTSLDNMEQDEKYKKEHPLLAAFGTLIAPEISKSIMEQHTEGAKSIEVWQCPDCGCEACYAVRVASGNLEKREFLITRKAHKN